METLKFIVEGLSLPKDKLIIFSQYDEILQWISSCLDTQVPYKVCNAGLHENATGKSLIGG